MAAIPLATTAHHSPMLIAFSEVGRQAIYADPNWNDGDYYAADKKPDAGLAVARMVGHITYLSEAVHAPEVRAAAAESGTIRLRIRDRVPDRELSQVQRQQLHPPL